MKQRNMTITAVACGALCAVCIGVFLASVQGKANADRADVLARYGGEQVEVCVATRDIAAGERVDASAVETRLWVADLLPEDVVRESSQVVGKIATSPILKGEAISPKRFEGERGAIEVPADKEAVSVPAKAVQAVGGAIRSGTSVDVYSSGDSGAVLIAGGVVVLDTSVGGSGSLLSSDAGWITLAVEPNHVQELITAASKTTLYFVVPGEGVSREDVPSDSPESDQEDVPDELQEETLVPGAASAGEGGGSASSAAARGGQDVQDSAEAEEDEGGDWEGDEW